MVTNRQYDSSKRAAAALLTRQRVLISARVLFGRYGIDEVTIARIAGKADVAPATVYALFKSKDGILQAIIKESLFGPHFQIAQKLLDGVSDAALLVALTAKVARAIYESETRDLGLIRGASAFSPALRKIERRFETMRYEMQADRLKLLFQQGKARDGLDLDTARRIMWMYTSRDIYLMLVHEGKWTPDAYEAWLERTLCEALICRNQSA
jgi:AcrR family transcriptional regulator